MSTPVSQAQWRRYAKKQFDSERVIRDIQTIYEKARWCSTAKFQQLCRALSKQLVSEGFSNVEILQVPGDGKHHYGGWTAPLSWSPKNATLDILADKKERLANYKKIPHQLMMFSGSTPAAGIKADLIIAPEKITRHNVKNKIVLHGRYNDLDYNLALFKAGARGVICDKVVEIKGIKEGKYLDDAIAYHNYSLPCWHIPRKERGIGFVISPRQGRLLRERLSAGEKIRLEAKVDIAIGEETTPLLTCRIPGRCAKDIVLTGHMDEPGASDNASGPAMALEIGRSMLALQKGKEKPVLERGLRFFFGIEVRSMQWLLNEQPKYMARACLGLNLDMLCTNPKKSKAEFIIHPNQASLPDYGLPILLDNLTELTKRPEYKLHFHNLDTNDNAMGEPATGVPTPILLLCPDTTYHTHFDNPSICHAPSIKRLGNCLTTYIGWLANADLQQLTGMAEINFNFAKKELTKNCEEIAQGKVHDPQVFGKHCLKREQGRINGLKKLQSQHNCISLVDGQTKSIPKPGLNLADQVIFSNTLDALCLKLEKFWQGKIKSLKNPKTTDLDISKALQNKARALVPVKTFRGFFSPSGLDEKQKAEIWPAMGIDKHHWSSPEWLNVALSLANGKRSLWDIYQFLRFENLNVNLEKLLDCFKAFEKCKFISTRPVIKSSDLSRAFKQVGVKPGMTLMVHTGVSQFGYLDMGMTGLINQLEKAVGIKGTLCMPTHSLSFSGSNPYNKKKSISTVGALTNAFIRMPDVYRSAHPTHSVACKGPKATALIKGHHAACPPQGETGFWGNFLADDAWVLMMAPMGTNTLIHLAENLEGIPTPAGFIPKKKDGKWQHRECPNMPMNTHWFDKVHDLLDRKKLLKRVVLGESEIVLMRAQDVIDAATVILKKNPYIVLNGTEGVWNTAVKKNLDSIY